ncbi:MAG TPA: CPBP family intramembrane glutamic endopeptidase [Candidatus Eremiobacteraceae bacterium]
MPRSLIWPAAGVAAAIAITATMDANGLTDFSALPLIGLLVLFWYLQRLSRTSVGFVWGKARDYALAIAYPVVVLGAVVAVSIIAGATHTAGTNWTKAVTNIALVGVSTIIVAIVTEEGFFRGWLWASLSKAGKNSTIVLLLTSVAFASWHISEVTLAKGYTLPPGQVVLFIVNAAVMGLIWGLLRSISGSVVVASVSHGLWNGGAYALFGVGPRLGALGVTQLAIFGPEIGVVGLVTNLLFAAVLWRVSRSRQRVSVPSTA